MFPPLHSSLSISSQLPSLAHSSITILYDYRADTSKSKTPGWTLVNPLSWVFPLEIIPLTWKSYSSTCSPVTGPRCQARNEGSSSGPELATSGNSAHFLSLKPVPHCRPHHLSVSSSTLLYSATTMALNVCIYLSVCLLVCAHAWTHMPQDTCFCGVDSLLLALFGLQGSNPGHH